VRVSAKTSPQTDSARIDAAVARAHGALARQQYQTAARLFARVVSAIERQSGPPSIQLALSINQLAVCYRHLARFVDAGQLHQRALAILDSHGRGESVEAADVFHDLSALEHAARNWLRGESFAREALRIRTRLLGAAHPDLAGDLVALGSVLAPQGKVQEAERVCRQALAMIEDGAVHNGDLLAIVLNNLATACHVDGRKAEAVQLYRRLLGIDRSAATRGTAGPFAMNNLALLLAGRGELDEAARLYRRAIAQFDQQLGPDHPNVAVCLENYAAVLRRQGRRERARVVALRARRIFAGIDSVNGEGVAVTGTINPTLANYRLSLRRSAIQRFGVFAEEAIPARKKVIEYTGEKISNAEGARRWDPRRSYAFELNAWWQLDGAIGGSGAEFINHSCEPNLRTRILRGHILYFSVRPIAAGEELTVDYHYDHDIARLPCTCGAPTCRGTMNVLPPKKNAKRMPATRDTKPRTHSLQ